MNSMIYRDQILLRLLKEFWEEAFGYVTEHVVVEDNASVHKKVYIPVRQRSWDEMTSTPSKLV